MVFGVFPAPAGSELPKLTLRARVAELVDAQDLKSCEGNLVRVRFPPLAPIQAGLKVEPVSGLKKQGQGFAEFLVQVF